MAAILKVKHLLCRDLGRSEDQNAFNLGFMRGWNDLPSWNCYLSHILSEVFMLEYPIPRLSLSPPWSSFVLVRVEHLTVSPKSLSKQENVNIAGLALLSPLMSAYLWIIIFPLRSYKCAKGSWKILTGHILNTFYMQYISWLFTEVHITLEQRQY